MDWIILALFGAVFFTALDLGFKWAEKSKFIAWVAKKFF